MSKNKITKPKNKISTEIKWTTFGAIVYFSVVFPLIIIGLIIAVNSSG